MDLTTEMLLDFLSQARRYGTKDEHGKSVPTPISLSANADIMAVNPDGVGEAGIAIVTQLMPRAVRFTSGMALEANQEFCMRLVTADGHEKWIRCAVKKVHPGPAGTRAFEARFCDITCTAAGEQPILMDSQTMAIGGSSGRALTKMLKDGQPGSGNGDVAPLHLEVNAELIDSVRRDKSIRVKIRALTTHALEFSCRGPLANETRLRFTFALPGKKAKYVFVRVTKCVPLYPDGFQVTTEMTAATEATRTTSQ